MFRLIAISRSPVRSWWRRLLVLAASAMKLYSCSPFSLRLQHRCWWGAEGANARVALHAACHVRMHTLAHTETPPPSDRPLRCQRLHLPPLPHTHRAPAPACPPPPAPQAAATSSRTTNRRRPPQTPASSPVARAAGAWRASRRRRRGRRWQSLKGGIGHKQSTHCRVSRARVLTHACIKRGLRRGLPVDRPQTGAADQPAGCMAGHQRS